MFKKFAVGASALLGVLATPASAADIVLGQWYTFGFGGTGSSLSDGSGYIDGTNPDSIAAPAGPWTFTLTEAATLTVTDAFIAGDQFELFNFGSSLGLTSAPGSAPSCGNDISACLASSAHSKGSFALGVGSYSLTGLASASPLGGGAGYLIVGRAAAAVPEPATWLMMIAGFGLIGAGLRRRSAPVRVRFA